MAGRGKRTIMRAAAAMWLLYVAASTASTASGSKAAPTDNKYTDWEHDLAETTPGKHHFFDNRFYAGLTGSLGELLHILCQYRLASSSRAVSLRGSRDGNGDFWPAVSLAVSNDREANWAPIGVFNPTVDPDFLIVDRQNPKGTLWVAAERFRPFVGTQRWGRVNLISDKQATAVLALEDLLPPRGRRPEGADFKEVLGDREKPQFGSAAVLRYVIFIHGQLTGEFTWVRDHLLGTITGRRTTAGDFWPAATLEVGDSDGHWVTVGEAKPTGTLQSIKRTQHTFGEPFRVNFDAYKPHIGQWKFGKVTFSDSSFAIFLLQDINPDNTDDNLSD
jgi:hypothetical protein